jgi:CRP/FNR family transcriptional regulator, cyclic AMP receptor protein
MAVVCGDVRSPAAGCAARGGGVARTANPTAELLRRVDLFDGLTTKELDLVAGACRQTDYRAGADIVTQGERSARLYIIVDGTAEVRVHGSTVGKIGPGDYFGEMAVIDSEPRAATVTATTPMSVLSLANFNVKALLRSMPDIGFKMLQRLSARVRALESEPII